MGELLRTKALRGGGPDSSRAAQDDELDEELDEELIEELVIAAGGDTVRSTVARVDSLLGPLPAAFLPPFSLDLLADIALLYF